MNTSINFSDGFTVLMALYHGDRADFFERAVSSVFSNTLKPNQFIVVVDGPIPNQLMLSVEKIRNQYPLVEFMHLPTNQGLANALNHGLRSIRFPWVVRADADDINLPERFFSLAELIKKNPEAKLIGSAILEVDEHEKPIAIREVPCSEEEIRIFAKTRNPFNHMAVAYRLDAIQACGGYPRIFLKEDYGLWCHFLAKQFRAINTNQVLVHATTGVDMFKRRGGWSYAKSEIQMQRLLVDSGLKSYPRAVLDGLVRAIFFLIPPSLRGYLYIHALRKPY